MLLDRKIPVRYIFNKVKIELLYVVIVGLVIHFLTTRFSKELPEMPLTIPVFLGTAISILLSFKMSQSYDRWWEARKVWGAIVNDSRTFIVQLQSFVKDEAVIRRMAHRQIAWCYSLGQALRDQDALQGLGEYLSANDLEELSRHTNKPLAILKQNARELKKMREQGVIDTFMHLQMDDTLTRLCDSMGKAERIKSTVFPVTYRLFLHFTIYLFVVILSIALKGVDTYFEIPLLTLISMVFFLIEKSATHLQDPFRNRPSDIPVTAIARTIDINIRQLLEEENVPQPLPANDYYLL
jgi:ion channel-forming bestrophin family protein